jgi:hypothetical protein
MRSVRDRNNTPSRLRPLALALAGAAVSCGAATQFRPGELPADGGVLREDGTPLRTALRAWHLDAVANAGAGSPSTTHRIVTSCADDGAGSLREVVAASASGDTVDLGELACASITLQTGAIAVRLDSLTLVGPDSRSLAIDGNHLDRVFLHYGAGGFLLRNLTVRNGFNRATGFHLGIGGCIASAGYLTLDHSTVSGCYSGGEGAYGGAIYAYSLLMQSSTLSGNVAYGVHPTVGTAAFGGAAFTYQIDLVDSTVSGNRAMHRANPPHTSYDIGGGISVIHGGLVVDSTIDSNYANGRGGGLATFDDLLVLNSTVSGNVARTFVGGGLFVRYRGRLDARNSTITANFGSDGGGIFFTSRQASIDSTIVAGNSAGVRDAPDIASSRGVVLSGAGNLIGSIGTNVEIPSGTRRGDPGLQPLAYNGGPTRTHALSAGSTAIDGGNNPSQLASDQRGYGFPRVVGPAPDIGAFEFGAGAPPVMPAAVPTLSRIGAALLLALLALLGGARVASKQAHRATGF